MTVLRIDASFDGGNIECILASEPDNIRLRMRPDACSDIVQWFNFRVSGAAGRSLCLKILNAGDAAFKSGWRDYAACVSHDGETWRRAETSFDGAELCIRDQPPGDEAWYAYFAPYDRARHDAMIANFGTHPEVRHEKLGASVDGTALDLLTIGAQAGAQAGAQDQGNGKPLPVCWLLARQHPGETMAEWWMEGFLERLLSADDPLARHLRSRAVFNVVPNMNPDGSHRGHLRLNALGEDLNRAWAAPDPIKTPEVAAVLGRMEQTGVDFCLDVHGDEALPYVFLSSAMLGVPSLRPRQKDLLARFTQALLAASPDFQTARGYPTPPAGKANLGICANQIAERFGCLAVTLEQPFKDNADAPDVEFGWSPSRSRQLGAEALAAIAAVVDDLRDDS